MPRKQPAPVAATQSPVVEDLLTIRETARLVAVNQDWPFDKMLQRSAELFGDHDALLTPISTRPPVAAGNWEGGQALPTLLGMMSTYPFNVAWNLTGQPAAAIPAGPCDDGLPIGLQLVGRPDGEATLLSLSAQLEGELGWPQRRPPVS